MKVFHITSVHPRYDTRIFKKECISLANAGYDVSLIVCDGQGDEILDKVRILDIGNYNRGNRIRRFLIAPKKIKKIVLENKNVAVVHFHDPELIFLGKDLTKKGIKVIYDSHENVPKQIMSKPYIPVFARRIISNIVNKLELSSVKKIAAVVTVTEEIQQRFHKINKNTVLVRNYPIIASFSEPDYRKKNMSFLYAGGVTKIRGALEMSKAGELAQEKIKYYGPIESAIESTLKESSGCDIFGNVLQEKLIMEYQKSSVGLCVLHKVPNYLDSYPIKLFEYMASGMAVISSDIPMWKEIIEKFKCGICVNPSDVEEIAKTIIYMKEHPKEVEQMGRNGRKAVEDCFSWENESIVLDNLYKTL